MWFPGIDAKRKRKLDLCMSCQATGIDEHPKMAPPPDGLVASDYYGPLSTGTYLLVVTDGY